MDGFLTYSSDRFNRSSGCAAHASVPLIRQNIPTVCFELFYSDFSRPVARGSSQVSKFLSRFAGFTLMELIITLAIASVLLTLSVPSLSTFIRNNRITTETNSFIGQINAARSEAGKRGCIVAICRRDPSKTNPTCGGGTANDWSSGWLLYAPTPPAADADCNTEKNFDPLIHTLIKEVPALTNGIRVTSSPFGDQRIGYRPNGYLTSDNTLRYALCDDRNEAYGRLIEILPSGRPSPSKTGAAVTTTCSPSDA